VFGTTGAYSVHLFTNGVIAQTIDSSQNTTFAGSLTSGAATVESLTSNNSIYIRDRAKLYFYADDDATTAFIWNNTGGSGQLDFWTGGSLSYVMGSDGSHDMQGGVLSSGAHTITDTTEQLRLAYDASN